MEFTRAKTPKPHYRLRCNFGDAKPLWWVEQIGPLGVLGGIVKPRNVTGGRSTAAAAISALMRLPRP